MTIRSNIYWILKFVPWSQGSADFWALGCLTFDVPARMTSLSALEKPGSRSFVPPKRPDLCAVHGAAERIKHFDITIVHFDVFFKYLSVIGVGFNSLLITPGTFPCRSTNHRFTRKTALQPSQKVDLRCLLFKFRIRSFLEETHTHQCWKPCRMFGDAKPCWGMPSISFQRPWSGSEPTKPWKGLPTVPGTVSGVSADSVANTQIPTALPEIWWFRVGWIGICESLPHELPCCLTCGGVGQAIWARLPRCLCCGLHCLVALHFESSVLCTVLTQFDKSAAKDHVASNFLLDRAENRG